MRKAMKILLAVDGSECGLAAVEETARTPWPEDSVVKIVSVAELPMAASEWTIPGTSFEDLEQVFDERAVAIVTQALARFGEITNAKTEATSKTLDGDPKTAILDEAESWGADLIVVGTHSYNALKRFWLGSVSRAVASHAKCSVQIVRCREGRGDDANGMKILLAVDGSEFSDAAVDEIANRPWPPGTQVHVISVVHLPFTPSPETYSLPESYYFKLEKAGLEQAESAINRAILQLRSGNSERERPLTITSEIIVGHPEETIIEASKKYAADLIALGSHGYRGFRRFLLGSVSQAVASHAPCSVEIVRPKV
jgi:nucleotide-binding universal stress UspA family protein